MEQTTPPETQQTQLSVSPPEPKSKLPLIIGVIILLIIVGGGMYLLGQKSIRNNTSSNTEVIQPTISPIQNKPSSFIKPTQSLTTNDETDNWKTYTNINYGYSFKYPSNFILTDRSDSVVLSADGKSNIIMTCNKFIFTVDSTEANLQITPEFYTFKVGNRNGNRLDKTVMLEGSKCTNSVIIIRTPDRTDIKSINISLSRQEKEYPKLFDQILSTFKFTDQKQSSISPDGFYTITEQTIADTQLISITDKNGNIIVDDLVSKNSKEIGYNVKFKCQCGTSFKKWVTNTTFSILIKNGGGEEYEYLVDAKTGKVDESSFKRIK